MLLNNLDCHIILLRVPLWPLRQTGCIIKRVPAGVRCPGERGENKACWRKKTPLLFPMEKPCQEIVMAGNLDGFRDVLMNHIWVNSLTHWHIAVRSHVDRKDTKSPATSGITIHWGVAARNRHIQRSISSLNCHLHGNALQKKPFLFCNKQLFSHQVLQLKKNSFLHPSEAIFTFASAFHT